MRKNHSYFKVTGKVQRVMFRQTFIRACQSRGLKGGASNLEDGTVSCFISGNTDMIDDIQAKLLSGNDINSWGACVDSMIPMSDAEGIPLGKHQVTTINVDSFDWNPDIEMYL